MVSLVAVLLAGSGLLATVVVSELVLGGAAALLVGEDAGFMIRCEFYLSVLQIGTRPLLVKQLVNTLGLLFALDVLDEGQHARLLVVLSENFTDKSVHVETGKGDELPAVAQ